MSLRFVSATRGKGRRHLFSDNCYFLHVFNPLNAELNPICRLLALLGAHHIFHVRGLGVKHRIKSHLLYAGIIRSSPYFPR